MALGCQPIGHSIHPGTTEYAQVNDEQFSVVHGSESSHSGSTVQDSRLEHGAELQPLPPVHAGGTSPTQLPPEQTSALLQEFASSQGVPSGLAGFEHVPVPGSHVPASWH
jgi:hypothetical protein